MPANNITVAGTFNVNSYTITYTVDGNTDGDVETYNFGTPISIRTNPTKTGYTFSGWDPLELPATMPA